MPFFLLYDIKEKSCNIYWERGANCRFISRSMLARWLLVNGNRVSRPILTASAVNRSVYLSQRSRRPPYASTLASIFTAVLLYVGVTDAHAGCGYWLSGTPTIPGARQPWALIKHVRLCAVAANPLCQVGCVTLACITSSSNLSFHQFARLIT